jgi:hypothetical protein
MGDSAAPVKKNNRWAWKKVSPPPPPHQQQAPGDHIQTNDDRNNVSSTPPPPPGGGPLFKDQVRRSFQQLGHHRPGTVDAILNTVPPIMKTNSAARAAAAAASGPLFKDQVPSASQQLSPNGGEKSIGFRGTADFAEWPPPQQHDGDQAFDEAAGAAAVSNAATVRKQGDDRSNYKDDMRGAATMAAATVGTLDGTTPTWGGQGGPGNKDQMREAAAAEAAKQQEHLVKGRGGEEDRAATVSASAPASWGGQGGPSYKDRLRGAAAAVAAKQQEYLAKGGRRGGGENNDTAAMSNDGPAFTTSSPFGPPPRPQRRDAPRASVASGNTDDNAYLTEAQLVVENNDPAPLLVQATEVKRRRYAVVAGVVAVILAVIAATVGVVCGGVAGSSCRTSSSSSLPLPACNVTVAVDCRVLLHNGDNDTECADLRPPITASCFASYTPSNGTVAIATYIDVLQFSYDNTMICNASRHSQGADANCKDHGPPQRGDAPVQVKCYPYTPYGPNCTCCLAARSELPVSPATVRTGEVITVTASSNNSGGPRRLPHKIECIIKTAATKAEVADAGVITNEDDDYILQTIIVDVSGRVGLNLGDSFGALRVHMCGNRTCFEQIRYTVGIRNSGRDALDLTDASLEIVPGTGTKILRTEPLPAGDTAFFQEVVTMNTCLGDDRHIWATVQARSTAATTGVPATTCQHGDSMFFTIDPLPTIMADDDEKPSISPPDDPLTPSPSAKNSSCSMTVTVDCTLGGADCFTGLPCSIPYIGRRPCALPPSSARMLYTGGNCSFDGGLGISRSTCQDYNGGPTSGEGNRAHILVWDGSNNVYLNETVNVGDDFLLDDIVDPSVITDVGSPIVVTISTADGEGPENTTLLQEIRLQDYACVMEPDTLYGRVGALQLLQVDTSSIPFFVINGRNISVAVTMSPSDNSTIIELTSLMFRTSFAGDITLTDDDMPTTVGPAGTVVVTLEGEVDDLERREYTIQASYTGVRLADGTLCEGTTAPVYWEMGHDPLYPTGP